MEGWNRLQRATGEDRWEEERKKRLELREEILKKREGLRAEHHDLEMRNSRRFELEDNVWAPFAISIVVLWKLLTRPSKEGE